MIRYLAFKIAEFWKLWLGIVVVPLAVMVTAYAVFPLRSDDQFEATCIVMGVLAAPLVVFGPAVFSLVILQHVASESRKRLLQLSLLGLLINGPLLYVSVYAFDIFAMASRFSSLAACLGLSAACKLLINLVGLCAVPFSTVEVDFSDSSMAGWHLGPGHDGYDPR